MECSFGKIVGRDLDFCETGSTLPPNADTQFSHIFYVWYVKVTDMNQRVLLRMRGGRK
ncbi:MAG: hypothetical protein WB723_11660 [Candidatus Acidiferrales bacterium]